MNNLSYWERKTWLDDIDIAIVGSGIVGLTTALSLKERKPNAKIVLFERGILPSGASTKNAGFACFGSVSEILDDLKSHSETEVMELIRKRYLGLQRLRNLLGDKALGMEWNGGYELFPLSDQETYAECLDQLDYINELAKEAVLSKNEVFFLKKDPFSFKNVQNRLIYNQFEGQLDTGSMMKHLIQLAQGNGIFILNGITVESYTLNNDQVILATNPMGDISSKNLLIATNGFAKQFVKEEILPARAQVLVTEPIDNLSIKGTFHLDKGYYYFRNIENRILLGGGRNLDREGETTTQMEITTQIQDRLEDLLRTVILPGCDFSIAERWSGIMGVGSQKKPIVKTLAKNVHCGIRMGGMGVAIGSLVGEELSQLCTI